MSEVEHQAIVEIRAQVDAIHGDLEAFPWANRATYAEWLAQTYFYVRRVTHALATAASRTTLDQTDLHSHFLRAIGEEKDHDQLAVDDLRDLDFDIQTFVEHPLTHAFYQTLVHMIEHDGPEATLGYFFVLEGVAGEKGEGLYTQVMNAYDGKAGSFLREHIIADAEHFPKALQLLSTLDERQLDIVERSARLAGPLYRYLVKAIVAEVPRS